MKKLNSHKTFYIVATNFSSNTGGLLWTSKLAMYAQQSYRRTELIDLSKEHHILRKYRLVEMIYYLGFFIIRSNYFIFIDHRLHLRFVVPLLVACVIKKAAYATICHHVFYMIKANLFRRIIEYLSECIFLKHARLIVVPSAATSSDLQKMKINKKRISVINPAPTIISNYIPVKLNKKRILMVGNIEPRKGLDSAIDALALMKQSNFILDIIGGYEGYYNYYQKLRGVVITKGLTGKIFFHGRVHQNDIKDFYRKADIFLFPSKHEGYGIVLLEALSFGLPIVATNIPTTREILKDGINGLLCPIGDVRCLAHKLEQLLNDKSLQKNMSRHNFAISRGFRNWNDVIQNTYRTVYPYII